MCFCEVFTCFQLYKKVQAINSHNGFNWNITNNKRYGLSRGVDKHHLQYHLTFSTLTKVIKDMSSEPTKTSSENSKKVSGEKSPTKTETASDNSSSSTKTNKSSTPARPTSYFSSVSTDEYRSGWDTIFNDISRKNNKVRKSKERNAKLNLPLTIVLSNEDLSTELNELLKKAVRKRAKKDKLPIGKLLNRKQIKWNLECKLGE